MKSKYFTFVIFILGLCLNSSAIAEQISENPFQSSHIKIAPNTYIYSEYYPNQASKFKGTIIFENGGGSSISEWKKTIRNQPTVTSCAKRLASVFMYDRSGIGKSNPDLSVTVVNPITAEKTIDRLLYILNQQRIKPPYILLVHSYGGIYGQYFVRKYPNLISGIIFIDPVVVNYKYPRSLIKKLNQYLPITEKHTAEYMYRNYKDASFTADTLYTLLGYDSTTKQINRLPPLNSNIPIVILASTEMNKTKPKWYEYQRELSKQSLKSKLLTVKSSHYIMQDKPEIVCRELENLINQLNVA